MNVVCLLAGFAFRQIIIFLRSEELLAVMLLYILHVVTKRKIIVAHFRGKWMWCVCIETHSRNYSSPLPVPASAFQQAYFLEV